MNLEEARRLARELIEGEFHYEAERFDLEWKVARYVSELADEVERLRLVEQHAQQVVYGIDYTIDYPKPWPALDNLKAALATPREEEA